MPKAGILILLFLYAHIGLAQTEKVEVNIQQSSISIAALIEAITEQTGYHFSYRSNLFDDDQKISFYAHHWNLDRTLKVFCEKTGLNYQLIEGQIVLKQGDAPLQQKQYTLSGYVKDIQTGETLIGATLYLVGTSNGVVTNEFGYYALEVDKGPLKIEATYLGYERKVIEKTIENDARVNISLGPGAIDLPNVIVDIKNDHQFKEKDLDHVNLSSETLQNMPELAGESGVINGLQSLPGVKMHSDGSAFFYIRGGQRDQNLIILDDAPVYNPSHLFGFYSMVIPDFTKDIQVYKSDTPTHLGDRLSSIISIRTKDGNINKPEFKGALNPLINRISYETPVFQNQGAIFAALRRSNFEWLYRNRTPNADLSFGDLIFKWNHQVNIDNRLFFTAFFNGDRFAYKDENTGADAGITWGNFTASLRWNHIFGPKLFSNTTLYTGNYGYRIFFKPSYWQSALGTLSLKSDFTHYAHSNYTAKFGIELQGYFIDPGSFALDSTIAVLPKIQPNYSQKNVLHYQGTLKIKEDWTLKAGVRMVRWANLGPVVTYRYNEAFEVIDTLQFGTGPFNEFFRIDPRVSLAYRLKNNASVKLSYGRYHQYLSLISNSISPFTSMEIWLPASPNILPQQADQFTFNYSKLLKQPGLDFNISAYYKTFRNQIDYKPHATILFNRFLEGELRFGTMYAYGIETQLKKESGRLNGWINYTYSRVLRQTNGLNNGNEYPAFQDRPHEISILGNYQLNDRFFLSGYFTAFSGAAFSSPTGFYQFNDQTVPIYDEKHNDRLPFYSRLDVSVQYRLNRSEESRLQHSLTFSIYNALARKNVVNINFNKIPSEGSRPLVKTDLFSDTGLRPSQLDLIRFFPSLTYKFKY